MKKPSRLASLLLPVVLVCIFLGAADVPSARAATYYSWTWTSADWNGAGTLGVDPTNTITSFTGAMNGAAVTGLAGPDPIRAPNYQLYPDQTFVLDRFGFEFLVDSATPMQLIARQYLSCDCTLYTLFYDIEPDGSASGLSGDFAIAFLATTPIPAPILLFGSSLGALGLLGWRRARGRT